MESKSKLEMRFRDDWFAFDCEIPIVDLLIKRLGFKLCRHRYESYQVELITEEQFLEGDKEIEKHKPK